MAAAATIMPASRHITWERLLILSIAAPVLLVRCSTCYCETLLSLVRQMVSLRCYSQIWKSAMMCDGRALNHLSDSLCTPCNNLAASSPCAPCFTVTRQHARLKPPMDWSFDTDEKPNQNHSLPEAEPSNSLHQRSCLVLTRPNAQQPRQDVSPHAAAAFQRSVHARVVRRVKRQRDDHAFDCNVVSGVTIASQWHNTPT